MADSTEADRNLNLSIGDRAFLSLYFGSHKLPAALCSLLKAAEAGIQSTVVGTWLGLLTPEQLSKLDAWYYNRGFKEYVDKSYNNSGLFPWEQEVISTYFSGLHSILIAAGAGGGREMLALNRMGLRVDGYEYNPGLVSVGNTLLAEEGFPPTLAVGPANGLPAGNKQYDGVIVGWGTYTLIAGRAARIALLRPCRPRRTGLVVVLRPHRRHRLLPPDRRHRERHPHRAPTPQGRNRRYPLYLLRTPLHEAGDCSRTDPGRFRNRAL